jgi:hypothetical protein
MLHLKSKAEGPFLAEFCLKRTGANVPEAAFSCPLSG